MRYCVYILVFTLVILPVPAGASDSLLLVSNRLHQALNSNENGCYEIKLYAKSLTRRDTAERISLVKFYPFTSSIPQDSVRNFYYRCGFEPWGYINHEGTSIWYNSDLKQMKVKEWEPGPFNVWLDYFGWYLYTPLFMKSNILDLKHRDFEKYFISDDSLYYFGKSYSVEDSLTKIYSVEISYEPILRITITEDFASTDPLGSQYTRFEITEINSDTISHIPKGLSLDYLSMMPGYQWKSIEEKKASEPKVKEGAAAMPWQGLLLSGDTLRSSDIKERFVILDFWYKACGPCWASIKDLSRYNNNRGNDISILAVNVGDWKVKEDAVTIFKRQGGNYQVLFDVDESLVNDYEISGYPNIFILDSERNEIIFRQNGHPDDLLEKIDECIKKAREK